MRTRGFTLVELVMVIMITGIVAASLTVFLKPAIDSYFDTRRRADLTDMADTALRRMAQDIRRAVPNSVRAFSDTCFELVPTIAGGRYRLAVDTVNAGSLALDVGTATTGFDVLSAMTGVVANDWVVIGNENGGDVYSGATRGQLSADPADPGAALGRHRLTLGAKQFPSGYDGGRFVVVSDTERMVTYSCQGNTLVRIVSDFDADVGASCNAAGATVATDVTGCTFIYNPNQGETQQSGFVWMRLQLSRQGEDVTLAYGAHVSNVP